MTDFLSSILFFFLLFLRRSQAALDATTMNEHLTTGARLLGTYTPPTSRNLSNWMSAYNDSTPIQSLNIPGTHDSLTWNTPAYISAFVETQDVCLFDQLNSGVRFVDLRIGILQGQIRLYHASYLLDSSVEIEDIFWGLYYWLDMHPTETVLVSMKVDNGNNTAALQQRLYTLMTSPDISSYWVRNTTLPTLGQARHKLIPIRRLALSADTVYDYEPIGIDLSSGWRDNYPNISITYSTTIDSAGNILAQQQLFIEDLYNPDASDEQAGVDAKFTALETHLDLAAAAGTSILQSAWYIGFASGYNGILTTPDEMALGSTVPSKVTGVNPRLLQYLIANRGKYFGVIMVDYVGADLRLVNATLGWEVGSGYVSNGYSSPVYVDC